MDRISGEIELKEVTASENSGHLDDLIISLKDIQATQDSNPSQEKSGPPDSGERTTDRKQIKSLIKMGKYMHSCFNKVLKENQALLCEL